MKNLCTIILTLTLSTAICNSQTIDCDDYKYFNFNDNWCELIDFITTDTNIIDRLDIRIERHYGWGQGSDSFNVSYKLSDGIYKTRKYYYKINGITRDYDKEFNNIWINKFAYNSMNQIIENINHNLAYPKWISSSNNFCFDFTGFNQVGRLNNNFRTECIDDTHCVVHLDFFNGDKNAFTYYIGFSECMSSYISYEDSKDIDKYGMIQWLMLYDLFKIAIPKNNEFKKLCVNDEIFNDITNWIKKNGQ
ncbi:MAG: hypothetical protein IPF54_14175 [Draconibacterium sp.]|nr:hypothetical protein [Draconibacterium sp.]